jgi:integrase/recombinase XerD
MEEQLRTDNPADLLETPRKPISLPAVIDRAAAALLFDTLDTDTPLGIRDRALYELLYATGLRVSEAAALDLKDLMLSKQLIRVKGKRNKERLVIFGEQAASWLKRYLTEVRPLLGGIGGLGSALFIGRTGKRLSRKGIWKNYAEAAGAAGVSSKLHTLRHTFATELLRGGADLRSVQELLGHSDLKSTQVYTHVDVSMLRESHRRYMPTLREYT